VVNVERSRFGELWLCEDSAGLSAVGLMDALGSKLQKRPRRASCPPSNTWDGSSLTLHPIPS